MLRRDRALLLVEIDRHLVGEIDDQEVEEGPRRRQAENLGHEGGRALPCREHQMIVWLSSTAHQPAFRSNSQTRIALARLAGKGAATRSASIRATSAFSGSPSAAAASRNASQKTGSRLIEVACPAIMIERFTGPIKPSRRCSGEGLATLRQSKLGAAHEIPAFAAGCTGCSGAVNTYAARR